MSCGGTTCTSTSIDIPASKPFAGFEWLRQGPPPRLAEIDLSREQAVEEARKTVWFGITTWQL
jgi:hypothetical protein